MSKITRMGIDLGKNDFHVCAMDRRGRVLMTKRFTRRGLEKFVRAQERCLVGMEACGGAHHWARMLRALGYDARLMSAQFVKAYVKSNKNDWRDAEAICEAVGRPTMRYVPVKTVEQQSIQHLHRARARAVSERTALANQIRGFLFEYGLVVRQGISALRRRVPEILEDAENGLALSMRELLVRECQELVHLDERVKEFDAQLDALARDDQRCRRLQTIPGIGPKVASALVAAAGDAKEFGTGREFAAWLGLTPRQRSTGGRTVLGGISKRGLPARGGFRSRRGSRTPVISGLGWTGSPPTRRSKEVKIVPAALPVLPSGCRSSASAASDRVSSLHNTIQERYRLVAILSLMSVTASMTSAGRGSRSSPSSARTACQSGSIDFSNPALSIKCLIRCP